MTVLLTKIFSFVAILASVAVAGATDDGDVLLQASRRLDAGVYVPPTKPPTQSPSAHPSRMPSVSPTPKPTIGPTKPPTKPPTKKPTESPSEKPTMVPTLSSEPSTSASPTVHQAPACSGTGPFCWDGPPNDGYWGYAQCAVVAPSEHCGKVDFTIVGYDFKTGGQIEYERCSDVWDWFVKCIEYSFPGCEKRMFDGTFHYRRFTKFEVLKSSTKWRFRMTGTHGSCYDDCNQEVSWTCNAMSDADAIKQFALAVAATNNPSLFEEKPRVCETSTPTSSVAPTASPAPTLPLGPKCDPNDRTQAFCDDSMIANTCSVTLESQFCGPFDYVIEGDDEMQTSDVREWLLSCLDSYRCERFDTKESRSFIYNQKPRTNRSYDQGRKMHELTVKYAGNLQYRYRCALEDSVVDMERFVNKLNSQNLIGNVSKPWQCPDPTTLPSAAPSSAPIVVTNPPSPEPTPTPTTAAPTEETMSPTVCADSYFYNPPLNILVVMDISYSTYTTDFVVGGSETGDVNGDGKANTILDAEIEATIAMLNTVLESEELDNSNVNIGLVVFDTEAKYEGHYPPLNADNNKLNPVLVAKLKSIQTLKTSNDVIFNNVGYTNMDDALDKAIEYFSDATRPAFSDTSTNLMVFLGDGKPNVRGDGDDEDWCPDVDCTGAPPNVDNPLLPSWEQGGLSFCTSGDTGCFTSPFVYCARGYNGTAGSTVNCEEKEAAKTFTSELKELDRLNTVRLSIGVGAASYTEVDSALWRIDNNPFKVAHNLLPRQVMNADDLIYALQELCPEKTPNPTNAPSVSPSNAPTITPNLPPTAGPSRAPTTSPTSGPTNGATADPTSGPTESPTADPTTESPSASPTSAPSASPTADICDYTIIDFAEGIDGTSSSPNAWQSSAGLKIWAVPDLVGVVEDNDEEIVEPAVFSVVGGEAGTTLVVASLGGTTMNPTGGTIQLILDQTQTKNMKLVFWDIAEGGVINAIDASGEVISGAHLESIPDQLQTVLVDVTDARRVDLTFFGKGSLAEMRVCRDPLELPVPVEDPPGVASPGPTGAPYFCPENIVLEATVGSTGMESLPIRILSQTRERVKLEVTTPFPTLGTPHLFAQYSKRREERCVEVTPSDDSFQVEILDAECMSHAPISIIDVFALDTTASFLDASLDDAELPICCHGPDGDFPIVQYTFKVYCIPQCPEDYDVSA